MNPDMSVVLFMTLSILAFITMASEPDSAVEVMSVCIVLFMTLLILLFKSMGAEPELVVGASTWLPRERGNEATKAGKDDSGATA